MSSPGSSSEGRVPGSKTTRRHCCSSLDTREAACGVSGTRVKADGCPGVWAGQPGEPAVDLDLGSGEFYGQLLTLLGSGPSWKGQMLMLFSDFLHTVLRNNSCMENALPGPLPWTKRRKVDLHRLAVLLCLCRDRPDSAPWKLPRGLGGDSQEPSPEEMRAEASGPVTLGSHSGATGCDCVPSLGPAQSTSVALSLPLTVTKGFKCHTLCLVGTG